MPIPENIESGRPRWEHQQDHEHSPIPRATAATTDGRGERAGGLGPAEVTPDAPGGLAVEQGGGHLGPVRVVVQTSNTSGTSAIARSFLASQPGRLLSG